MSPISTVVALFVLTNLLFHACARSGTATFYTPPYQPSACNGYKDDGVMIAEASSALWNHGRACGKVLHVRCVGATNNGAPHPCRRDGATVTVRIVDFCPPGCRGTIDLSEEAFAEIVDPNAGKIKISEPSFPDLFEASAKLTCSLTSEIRNKQLSCRIFQTYLTEGGPQPSICQRFPLPLPESVLEWFKWYYRT